MIYKWKFIDFDWESEEHRNQSISAGNYSAAAVTPIDVFIHKETFLAFPRDKGVPAGLATVNTKKLAGGGPVLRPYPDWSWTGSKCDKSIISVYRVDSDKCGRLWVLDNGKIGETEVCPPKILAFELETRKLLLMKEIPKEYAYSKEGKGLLVTPIVHTTGRRCEKLTMYIADIEGYALVVWDGKDKFKRFESDVFTATKPDFTLNNVSFHLEDGLVGMALTKNIFHKPYLYFTSLASTKLYHVAAKEVTVDSNGTPKYIEDKGDVDFRKVPLVIENHIMYMCSLEDNALMSWDTRTKYQKRNLKTLWKNDKVLQFVSGMKSTIKGSLPFKGLYGISNKFQKAAAGIRDINEYNFYIFTFKL